MYPFMAAFDKAVKADKGDAWAAPALQTLYCLRDQLTSHKLSTLLPALLRLRGDYQVWPACLPVCMFKLLYSCSSRSYHMNVTWYMVANRISTRLQSQACHDDVHE